MILKIQLDFGIEWFGLDIGEYRPTGGDSKRNFEQLFQQLYF